MNTCSGVTTSTGRSRSQKGDRKEKFDEEELAGDDSDGKNWKGILIALLVIIIICGLVIVAVVLVTPKNVEEILGEPFTLDDLLNADTEYKINVFASTWLAGTDSFVYRSEYGHLLETIANTNETKTIIDALIFRNLKAERYFVSGDGRYVLLAYDIEPIYHRSFKATYVIYNREAANSSKSIIAFPLSVNDNDWDNKKLTYAGWSSKGHALTFVHENTLYFQPNPFTTPVRVTDNKLPKSILNGIPDWLYEAYIQFNDTNVPRQLFPVYGEATDIYGRVMDIPYPKAGDDRSNSNPTVKLYIAETVNVKGSHRLIQPPVQLAKSEYYIVHVRWRDDSHILVSWSNRGQNKTVVSLCNVILNDCRDSLIESQHEGKGWVLINDVRFVRKGLQYITILPQQIENTGFWNHIVLVGSDGMRTFLTYGLWDVMKIVGYNEEEDIACCTASFQFYSSSRLRYYIAAANATTNGDPRLRHLFRLKLATDGHRIHNPVCLTCKQDTQCQYVSADFSPSGRFYVEGCLGPGVPYYSLKSTVSDEVVMLEDNNRLKSKLSRKALPKKEYIEVETDDGQTIWGQLYLPPVLKKEHITLYPLLIHSHAGPDTQQVTEEFRLDWSTYLCSSENVTYASFDGRGTVGRGNRFLHHVYKNLGQREVQDQINGASYLKKTLQFVDKERIAIWGWSYGGFVVSHVLGDKNDTAFKCGIAVAPVTDWKYYDTAYTERYMGTPSSTDNYRGYDAANVSAKAKHFKEKGFLLIHGTADNNVHFQHSAQLIKSLTDAEVTFQLQVYPDKNHQLSDSKTKRHLYRTMIKFLQTDCWGGGKPHDAKSHVIETNQKQKKTK